MSIKLKGSSDGSVSFDAPADTSPSGSDITLTLPTSAGSANQFLKNSGIAGELEYSSMVEDSSNRVGIGTSSFGSYSSIADNLLVAGSSNTGMSLIDSGDSTQSSLYFYGGTTRRHYIEGGSGGSGVLTIQSNNAVKFNIGSGEQARLDSSGRLLAGATSSSGNFRAVFQGNAGNSAAGGDVVLARGAATPANAQALGLVGFSDNTHTVSGVIQCNRDGGTWSSSSKPTLMAFQTCADGNSTPTERMRIQSDGNVGVGFGSPSCKLDVKLDTSSATSAVFRIRSNWQATSQIQMSVVSNGNVANRNNSYGAISDAKLKENIVDANSQWEDIKNIRVRNYNFIVNEGVPVVTHIGVVAQELETVSPGLVSESPDLDDNGNDLGTTTKSVSYSVLYMKAVKALQEAQTRIETLESQHADLLARVTALEAA